MAGGRPTKFSQEMVEKAHHYIENFDSEEYGDKVPSVVGMAGALNVAKSTIYLWAQDEETGFSDTLEYCEEKQHRVTLNNGLSGEFNASIAKLVMYNHGYSEKSEQKVEGKVSLFSDMTDDELNDYIESMESDSADS